MNNEEKTKQAWQTPQIIDLDVDQTEIKYPGVRGSDVGDAYTS